RGGSLHLREDADLRQPPGPVRRGDRRQRGVAGQLPAGVHAHRADQRRFQPGPPAGWGGVREVGAMSGQDTYLETSVADWVGALRSSDPLLRRLGAYALGEIGPAAREAVPDLTAALQDPVRFVRVWAAAALARVAPPGREAVGVLVAEMKD